MFQRADGWCESVTEKCKCHSRTARLNKVGRAGISPCECNRYIARVVRPDEMRRHAAKKGWYREIISCPLNLFKEQEIFLSSAEGDDKDDAMTA